MNDTPKNLAVRLIISTLLVSCLLVNVKAVYSNSTRGELDLYTQKEPFSGKGLNASSDVFGPQESVILYASVTYGQIPQQNRLVTFYVERPDGASFSLTAETNTTGIATVNFSIPENCVNETGVFGEWFTTANVMIGTKSFQDTLTFEVDWIIKLISVETIDENVTHRTNFGVGGDVGLEITFRNAAMTMKNTSLAITILDELAVPISYLEIDNFRVQSNKKLVLLYCKLQIPKWAYVGWATVTVSALTIPSNQGGTAYCPPLSTNFYINIHEPLAIALHDVAVVDAFPSINSVKAGQPLIITVIVRDEGTEPENFNVSAYCDGMSIGKSKEVSLVPYSHKTLNFLLNTSAIDPGNYTITISIPHVAHEADFTDNVLVDGTVEIRPAIKKYYLTVKTDPPNLLFIPGENWYDQGRNINLTAPTEFSVSTGIRYSFSYWDVDGTPKTDNPIMVTMNTNHTTTAHYVLEFYLTVISPYGAPSGEDWYIANTTAYAALNTGNVTHTNETRRIFTGWSGDVLGTNYNKSNPILMNRPKTVIANWKTQYQITFAQTGLDSSASGPVITFENTSKTFKQLPYKIWVDANTVMTYSYRNVTSILPGKRFLLKNIVPSLCSTLVVISPIEFTGNYNIQYYLTVNTNPPKITEISGEGWYNQFKNVTLVASAVNGYDFDCWDIDGISQETTVDTVTVYMDGPYTAIAHYTLGAKAWYVPVWFWWLLPLLILLSTLFTVWLYRRRKRKKEAEEVFRSGWTAWYYCYDLQNRPQKP